MIDCIVNRETLEVLYKFVLGPNSQGLCGRRNSAEVLKQCLDSNDFKRAGEELEIFPTLISYLETIARISGFGPFDDQVVESYLFGSKLLAQATPQHYDFLLGKLVEHGALSLRVIQHMKKPEIFIPTHNFHTSFMVNPSIFDKCGVFLGFIEESGQKIPVARHHQHIIKVLTLEEKNNLETSIEEAMKLQSAQ